MWYGLGPHECYPDRLASGRLAAWREDDIRKLHTPYIFPSEALGGTVERAVPGVGPSHPGTGRPHCLALLVTHAPSAPRPGESGGRAGVRWMALVNDAKAGLLAFSPAGRTPLQMSVSPYGLESFEKARHDHELEVRLPGMLCVGLEWGAASVLGQAPGLKTQAPRQ